MRLLMGMPEPDSWGGPAACEPPFVAELRRRGISVDETTYVFGDRPAGTPPMERVGRVVKTARRLRRIISGGAYDLVHLNSSFDSRALLRDATTLGLLDPWSAKLFFKFHGSDADLLKTRNPVQRALVRQLLHRANGIGLLSSEEKENFLRAGVPEKKLFVVKNAVERQWPSVSAEFFSKLQLPADVPLILFIARLIPAKGLLDVIRASALLRDRGERFVLQCVGDGPARQIAEKEVTALKLNDLVRFTGQIAEAETSQFYVNSTMLVFPTYHYEGFPMTVFYAALAGLPIITTRIRAAADYLQEPANCLWVEARDPAGLAERIARLLHDPMLRESMGKTNRDLARQFTAENVASEYLDAYRKVIAEE